MVAPLAHDGGVGSAAKLWVRTIVTRMVPAGNAHAALTTVSPLARGCCPRILSVPAPLTGPAPTTLRTTVSGGLPFVIVRKVWAPVAATAGPGVPRRATPATIIANKVLF